MREKDAEGCCPVHDGSVDDVDQYNGRVGGGNDDDDGGGGGATAAPAGSSDGQQLTDN